jgi:hypothetical protein
MTLSRRSPRGAGTTATSPVRLPSSALAIGDSADSLPSLADASWPATSV